VWAPNIAHLHTHLLFGWYYTRIHKQDVPFQISSFCTLLDALKLVLE
jgi:hypothetical protein